MAVRTEKKDEGIGVVLKDVVLIKINIWAASRLQRKGPWRL